MGAEKFGKRANGVVARWRDMGVVLRIIVI